MVLLVWVEQDWAKRRRNVSPVIAYSEPVDSALILLIFHPLPRSFLPVMQCAPGELSMVAAAPIQGYRSFWREKVVPER